MIIYLGDKVGSVQKTYSTLTVKRREACGRIEGDRWERRERENQMKLISFEQSNLYTKCGSTLGKVREGVLSTPLFKYNALNSCSCIQLWS